MSKKNYSKISTEKAKESIEVKEETVVETAPVETAEPVVETKEPEVTKPETVIGIVSGCKKLNVRRKPFADAAIICKIDVDDEVEINESRSTPDFYAVVVSNIEKKTRIKGFCMKEFIKIKS